MANSHNKGRVYLDTASNQAVATDTRLKVNYALLIPNAAGDSAEIRESSSGTPVIIMKAGINGQEFLDFSERPVVMDGVYVQSISASAQVILYTSSQGGS